MWFKKAIPSFLSDACGWFLCLSVPTCKRRVTGFTSKCVCKVVQHSFCNIDIFYLFFKPDSVLRIQWSCPRVKLCLCSSSQVSVRTLNSAFDVKLKQTAFLDRMFWKFSSTKTFWMPHGLPAVLEELNFSTEQCVSNTEAFLLVQAGESPSGSRQRRWSSVWFLDLCYPYKTLIPDMWNQRTN